MSLFKQLVILLIRNTFLGRGFFRKHSIHFLKSQFLEKRTSPSNPIPSLVVRVHNTPFKFYFDELSNLSKFVGKDDKEEIQFLQAGLQDGFVFIDIGANNGFYSQMILSQMNSNKRGTVISIEPNPLMCDRIRENAELLNIEGFKVGNYIKIINCAVGESKKETFLDFSSGYGQAHINEDCNEGIPVKISPLTDILNSQNISRIDALKIDVEGYEVESLRPFFEAAATELLPKKIVIEYTHSNKWDDKDFIDRLVSKYDYHIKGRTNGNVLLLKYE
jgi:FkbM family methyltransferase